MRLFSRFLVCLWVAASLPAQSPAADADGDAIRELVAKYTAARGHRDAAAIEALFTADADQLVSSGEWRKGREALVRGMLGSSRRNPGGRTITVESVRLLAAGVALADARYEIADPAGGEPRKMWSTFLAVREADGWRIAAIRNMLPAR